MVSGRLFRMESCSVFGAEQLLSSWLASEPGAACHTEPVSGLQQAPHHI